jgi:hypothetical protein
MMLIHCHAPGFAHPTLDAAFKELVLTPSETYLAEQPTWTRKSSTPQCSMRLQLATAR